MSSEADLSTSNDLMARWPCKSMVGRAVISELWLKTVVILAELGSLDYLSNIQLFRYSYAFGKPCIRLASLRNGTDTNMGFCIRITEIPNTVHLCNC
jgi:hypothetical protein